MARLETRGAGSRASNVPRQRARITCRCAPYRTPSREEDGVARRHVVSIGGLVSVGLGLGLGLKSPARAEEGKYERTKLGVPYEEVYGETKRSPPLCWPTPPTSPSQRPARRLSWPTPTADLHLLLLGFLFDQVGTNADSSRVVQVGDDVLIDYVMRRSNGYFM